MSVSEDLRTGDLRLGKCPALIVVDMSVGFTSPDSPLGGDFQTVKTANLKLLNCFREKQWPVFFTSVVYRDKNQASVFRTRLPDLDILAVGSKWVEIDPDLMRQDNEVVIEKCWPSAFFGTNLAEQLTQQGVDSLVITGLTTSGCVRATAVDGLQFNYPLFVPRQTCGDRNRAAHKANLHDIHAKYGEVCELDWLLAELHLIDPCSG